jgi:carbohydrate binding protein with CBM5/12 domain
MKLRKFRGMIIVAVMLIASCTVQAQWSWQGTWSSATAYTANQVVSYLGSSYLCLVGNTNVAPPTSGTDWALIAQAGTAGAAGAAASVSIGSTYQGPPLSYPSVTNSGSSSAAVLNFTIPQSWGGGFVASINSTTGALTFSGSCFSMAGTAATINCPFSGLNGGTNTTAAMLIGTGASLGTTGTGTISANQLNAVPFCTGFTPTNGQAIVYTTGGTPNPCYGAASAPLTVTRKNCLSVSCSGGSTYASGTTYTNSSSAPVTEEVGLTETGSCTGADAEITFIVSGVAGYGNGVYNQCSGKAGVTFTVPAGATFSATATQIDGGGSTSITSWVETQW